MFNDKSPSSSEGLSLKKEKILNNSKTVFELFFKPDFIEGKYYKSPLREDNNPSFNIFKSSDGTLLFKDWGYKSGNVIDFVMELHNLSFEKAIDSILQRASLPKVTSRKKMSKDKKESEIKLTPLYRSKNGKPYYTPTDISYWGNRGVNIKRVYNHRIYSAFKLLSNGLEIINVGNEGCLFVEVERYKGKNYIKTYYPGTSDSSLKWRNNMKGMYSKLIHNYNRLPKGGRNLIITKSFKDCIILESLGFLSVSTQGEDIPIDLGILSDLKRRFDNIYLLYDNDWNKEDNPGRKLSIKYSEMYGLKRIEIPDMYKSTDTDELVLNHGRNTAKKVINEQIKNY